jgi:hypothetical protein
VNNTAGDAICAARPAKPDGILLSMSGDTIEVYLAPPTQTGGKDIGKLHAQRAREVVPSEGCRVAQAGWLAIASRV